MRIGVLTAFPDGNTPKSGIAYYAHTLLAPLANGPDAVTIFADQHVGDKQDAEAQQMGKSIRILRCWRFGMLSPFRIARALWHHQVDVLHVEYDVYLYGGVVVAILLPLVLIALRFLRPTQVVTTLHGVVPQHAVTRGMLRQNGFVLPFSRIGKLGFRVVYRLFDAASDRIIVLEHALASFLRTDYCVRPDKIFVIPIPLMNQCQVLQAPPKPAHADKGDRKRVLFIGYASYYKGLDVLLEGFSIARASDPSIELQVAAGRHPRLAGDRRYEAFYDRLQRRAQEVGATWLGFVPDADVAALMASASVVIFPYTAAYGGSAALNLALAARRPVLVSSMVYFDGALPGQVFDPEPAACAHAIVRYFTHLMHILEARVEEHALHRSASLIAEEVHDVRCGRDPLLRTRPQPVPVAQRPPAIDVAVTGS